MISAKMLLNWLTSFSNFLIKITNLQTLIFYFKFAHYPLEQGKIQQTQLAFFLFHFLFATGSTIFKIVTDWFYYLREKQVLETETMQSELRFLKSQINPHFLFNTLNNLYALTLKKSDLAHSHGRHLVKGADAGRVPERDDR